MIISHEHRFLFVEVPHTASHSISEQLVKHYGGQPILRKHANVSQFLDAATSDESRYFKFATVRNPLDAATTDFAKLKGNHREQFTNPKMRIENGGHVTKDHLVEFEFIRDNDADFADFFSRFRNKLYNNWFLIGARHFQYVIRFEQLQEGFSEVLKMLGVEQVEPIPHVNKTRAKSVPFEEFWTPEIRRQAARCYGPFMRKWGYAFPNSWGAVSVPWQSQLQFDIIDKSAEFATHFITMNPDSAVLHRAKKLVDLATRRA